MNFLTSIVIILQFQNNEKYGNFKLFHSRSKRAKYGSKKNPNFKIFGDSRYHGIANYNNTFKILLN